MIELKKGITKKHATSQMLIDFFLEYEDYDGHLYIGYPILFTGGESITVDALWISGQYGIIILDLIEDENDCESYEERQNLIYSKIESQLVAYPELKRGRKDFVTNQFAN